jgi:hypothetical protein
LQKDENTQKTEDNTKNTKEASNFIYLNAWWKIEDTYIFRFSNKKDTQFCFNDNSQIFISQLHKKVIYIDNNAKLLTYPLKRIENNSNKDMVNKFIEAMKLLEIKFNKIGSF